MRTEVITKTYLKFNELSEEQQKKVIENFRGDQGIDFVGNYDLDVWHNFQELLYIIGFDDSLEFEYDGFNFQGNGASFKGLFHCSKDNSKIIEEIKEKHLDYILDDNKELYDLIRALPLVSDDIDSIEVYTHGHFSWWNECTMYSDNDTLQELSRAIAKMFFKELEATWDYIHSDEYIEETINCNNYEFDSETLELV